MPTALALAAEYGYWKEHPTFPLEDWQYEIKNDETRRGYWEWVVGQLEATDAG